MKVYSNTIIFFEMKMSLLVEFHNKEKKTLFWFWHKSWHYLFSETLKTFYLSSL